MKLGKTDIGLNHAPYFIAEMSGNHNQSLERALEIVDAAASTGANALKIQTYTPDTMTLDINTGEFFIQDKQSLWQGQSLYELYKKAMTPWEWHRPIMERCHQHGMDFFSTPFDSSAVEFLEDLGVSFYKIASFELNDLPLIKRVAQTKKPMIMSTGMASLEEIQLAVKTARENGCHDIVLLKCTSAYPAVHKDANLATLPNMRQTFGTEVGLSDHTMGQAVPIASVILGATVIEKHFTIKRADGGVDSAFSMEPHEFRTMIEDTKKAKESIGKISYEPSPSEIESRKFRRSIYISQEIKAGDVFSLKNIKVIRPGLGLEPKYLEQVLGSKAKSNMTKGTPLSLDKIDFRG